MSEIENPRNSIWKICEMYLDHVQEVGHRGLAKVPPHKVVVEDLVLHEVVRVVSEAFMKNTFITTEEVFLGGEGEVGRVLRRFI